MFNFDNVFDVFVIKFLILLISLNKLIISNELRIGSFKSKIYDIKTRIMWWWKMVWRKLSTEHICSESKTQYNIIYISKMFWHHSLYRIKSSMKILGVVFIEIHLWNVIWDVSFQWFLRFNALFRYFEKYASKIIWQ